MLHNPVNAYPHNVTVDSTYPISLTFKHIGSTMNHCTYKIYNTRDTSVAKSFNMDFTSNVYNGDTVCALVKDSTSIVNGTNYKWTVTQYQDSYDIYSARANVQQDIFIPWAYANQYNNFMSSVPEGVTFSSINQFIPVAWNTKGIEQPVYDSENNLIGGQYLEVNGERRLIIGYWENYPLYMLYEDNTDHPYTSAIIVESPFTTFPYFNPLTPSLTIPYRIFKNYLTSPYYFFKSRALPTTVLTVTEDSSMNLSCGSTYAQSSGSLVQSYNWTISKYGSDYNEEAVATGTVQSSSEMESLLVGGNLIDRSNIPITTGLNTIPSNNITLIGTQRTHIIKYNSSTGIASLSAPLDYFPDYGTAISVYVGSLTEVEKTEDIFNEKLTHTFGIKPEDVSLKCSLNLITTDNASITIDADFTYTPLGTSDVVTNVAASVVDVSTSGNTLNCRYVKTTWQVSSELTASDYKFNVYKTTDTGKPLLIASDVMVDANGIGTVCDYAVGNEHQYAYSIVPISTETNKVVGDVVETDSITTTYSGWTIMSIFKDDNLCDNVVYTHGDTWILDIELDNTDVTHNTSVSFLNCINNYPKQVKGQSHYITGGLSCVVGKLNCAQKRFDGSVQKLDEWRHFLMDNDLFLLRSSKGDCRIVAINANPTESYEKAKWDGVIPVTTKFEYTEVQPITNAIVR